MQKVDQHTQVLCDLFSTDLKERKIKGAFEVSIKTAELLKSIVSKSKVSHQADLISLIKYVGHRLQQAAPIELCIGNIARRILYFAREEIANSHQDQVPDLVRAKSLDYLLADPKKNFDPTMSFQTGVRQEIVQQIKDLMDEIHTINTNIAEQSLEHIHANEVILSHGLSRTVVSFLRYAAQKGRTFEVVVAETAPRFSGHVLANELASSGIQVTVVPDSAIFAVMSRVNKVIVGTHAVLANGGLCAFSGLHHVALAAKHHSVPLVVCTGLYKLCPLYPHDQDTFNQLRSPNEVLRSDEVLYSEFVRVLNPEFDYVPPELVSLFVTNLGGHNPSYIYRLLTELYNPEDYSLADPSDRAI